MDDPELAIDLVCRFREQFARRLLSQYILLAIVCRELVGRIGLSIAKLRQRSANNGILAIAMYLYLLDADGKLNLGNSFLQKL